MFISSGGGHLEELLQLESLFSRCEYSLVTEKTPTTLYLKEKYPSLSKYIRPFMMGKDFIQRKPRWCLWLVGISPSELRQSKEIETRIKNIADFRRKSSKESTRKKADYPTLFDEIQQPDNDYVALPVVSSENRKYIPVDYLSSNVVAGNKLFIVENTGVYDFGIITSSVHMAWMRVVCGRLKSDYSYSNTIVYNNFPWPSPTQEQREKIEESAQNILDARAKYPGASLADLYDEVTMPIELRKAHNQNDAAVMEAYGFKKDMTESEIVAELMKLYQKKVRELEKKA